MDNQQETQVTEAEMGWLAGIIEGEGSVLLFFGVRKAGKLNNVSPQVCVGNTDKALIEKYVDILKRLGVGVHVAERIPRRPAGVRNQDGSQGNHRTYKKLYFASTVGYLRAKKILDVIEPYMVGEKKVRAQLILKFIDQRLSRCVSNGEYSNTTYSREDIEMMLEVCKLQRTKHIAIIKGLLRDYTGKQQKAA